MLTRDLFAVAFQCCLTFILFSQFQYFSLWWVQHKTGGTPRYFPALCAGICGPNFKSLSALFVNAYT